MQVFKQIALLLKNQVILSPSFLRYCAIHNIYIYFHSQFFTVAYRIPFHSSRLAPVFKLFVIALGRVSVVTVGII